VKRPIVTTYFLVVFPVFAWSAHQHSSEEELLGLLDVSLEELLKVKVKGAAYLEQDILDVPSSVTVFNRQQIKRLGVRTLSELSNFVPGFQVSRDGDNSHYASLSGRGKRITAASSEILLLVDGVRFAVVHTDGTSNFAGMSLNHIESIEFIRGPGAALYGSNAMMGIINVVTTRAVNEVDVRVGNLGAAEVDILLGSKVGATEVDLAINHQRSSGDDYLEPNGFTGENVHARDPYEENLVLLKLRNQSRQLSFNYNTWEEQDFFSGERLASDYSGYGVSHYTLSFQQDFERGDFYSENIFSYQHYKLESRTQLSGEGSFVDISEPANTEPLFAKTSIENSEFRLVSHNQWYLNKTDRLSFGGEWRISSLDSATGLTNYDYTALVAGEFPIAYDAEQQIENSILALGEYNIFGVYGQYINAITADTRITLGLRYDNYDELAEAQLSPRFALVHTLNEKHHLKLLWGRAFRAPTRVELGIGNNPVIVGNPQLKPEAVESLELVWLARYRHLAWTLSGFHNSFKDPILQEPNTQAGADRQYRNAEQDPIAGVELELNYELNRHWLLGATATGIANDEELGFRESERLASLYINIHKQRWNLNVALAYRGERQGPSAEAGSIVDFNSYWLDYSKLQFGLTSTFRVYLLANNLLNKTVYYPLQSAATPKGIPARGRELSVGVEWSF